MKRVLLAGALAAALAAGCSLGPRPGAGVSFFDFGPAEGEPLKLPFRLRSVEVDAPAWLETPAMQYRLLYSDPEQRRSYAESRWVAPPSDLIEQRLQSRIASSESGVTTGGCLLRVQLDEFAQLFDSAQASRGVIEARAVLLAPRTDTLLALRRFSVVRPAAAGDARAGVRALSDASQQLVGQVRDWLDGLAAEDGAAERLRERCRGAPSRTQAGP